MEGEEERSEVEGSFSKASIPKRIAVVAAGGLVNIIFALLIYFTLMSCVGNNVSNVIDTVVPNYSAQTAGLQENDKILKINNYGVNSYLDITYGLATSGTDPVTVTVERDGETVVLNDVSFPVIEDESLGECFTLDFRVFGKRRSFVSTVKYSFDWTVSISKSIYSFFGTLFTGRADLNQVSGPVGTTTAIGQSVQLGLDSLLLVVALISINLGIVNLLPFPALDGGRILFLAIEAVRRKPMNQKVEVAFNAVGLILLLGLMAVITVKDIIHLF